MKKNQTVDRLSEEAASAKAAGLSYGKYKALIYEKQLAKEQAAKEAEEKLKRATAEVRESFELPKPHLTTSEHRKMVEMYQGGKSLDYIAYACDVTGQTVRNHLRSEGVFVERFRKVTEDERNEMALMYRNGKSTSQIANEYNLDKTTVRRHLRAAGCVLKDTTKTSQEIVNAVIEMYLSRPNVRYADISEKFGLSIVTVQRIVIHYKDRRINDGMDKQ